MKTDETLSDTTRFTEIQSPSKQQDVAKMEKKKTHVPVCADVCEVSRNKVEGEHMGSFKQPDALNGAVQKFIFRVTSLSLPFVKKQIRNHMKMDAGWALVVKIGSKTQKTKSDALMICTQDALLGFYVSCAGKRANK